MARRTTKRRTSKSTKASKREKKYSKNQLNDDIGEVTRLTMWRLQLEVRHVEQRAHDLFFQNLVKGTSHLATGQEAIASACGAVMQPDDYTFCTYRGHAHTLVRGASMEGILGELMGRECGLLGGKGGSMHLTDVEKGVGRIKWSSYGVMVLVLLLWWAYPYGNYEKATSMAGKLAFTSIGGTVLLLVAAIWLYRLGHGYSRRAAVCLLGIFSVFRVSPISAVLL